MHITKNLEEPFKDYLSDTRSVTPRAAPFVSTPAARITCASELLILCNANEEGLSVVGLQVTKAC